MDMKYLNILFIILSHKGLFLYRYDLPILPSNINLHQYKNN
jgi:hypothetical protein